MRSCPLSARFRDDVKFFAALEDEKRRKSLQTAASALKQGSEGESSRESKFVKFFKGAFSKSPEKLENPMEQNVDSAESEYVCIVKTAQNDFFSVLGMIANSKLRNTSCKSMLTPLLSEVISYKPHCPRLLKSLGKNCILKNIARSLLRRQENVRMHKINARCKF